MDHKSCHNLLGSLSNYVDGLLEDELCAEIERHLSECDDCQIVVDTLKKTVYLYHATAEQTAIPDGLRERLFTRLELDDFLKE